MTRDHVLVPGDGVALYGQDAAFERVSLIVASGDGMHDGDDQYYVQAGANALSLIKRAVELGNAGGIRRILDYACGYGRVARWLEAEFPNAEIVAADTDGKAVAAVRRILGIDARIVDGRLGARLGDPFDLIWMGSLATHIAEDALGATLGYLASSLGADGVIVFSTHGPYVAERIRRGEKTYGLERPQRAAILEAYERDGYGFAPYPRQSDYGISTCKPRAVETLIEGAGLSPVFYESRGWVGHQDVFGARVHRSSADE